MVCAVFIGIIGRRKAFIKKIPHKRLKRERERAK